LTFLGDHTKRVRKGITIGFLLFIISEAFAFISVFWAFFHSALSPSVEIGGIWPPFGLTTLNAFGLPLTNTVLLLSSGAFVTLAHHALIGRVRKTTLDGSLGTLILALLFTYYQGIEYGEASFSIADSIFGTVFFASTGLT
jgi:cytochrome c oxidase subunit 3